MYNLDNEGYPSPGAPAVKYLNHRFKELCTMCFEMASVIRDSTYLMALHNQQWASTQRILGGNPTA